jgi:DNA-binding CsgD family transcriptional regulator
VIRAAILSASASTRTALRERLAPAADVRVVAEADGVRALPLEVDVVLATEDAAEALLRRWEAQARRRPAPRLAAVLLLSSGAVGGGGTGGPSPPLPAAAERLASLPMPAWGLVSRDSSPEALAAAVRALHAGLIVTAPRLPAPPRGPWNSTAGARDGREVPQLTPRETEVLRLLARGAGNKQIAWELGVSEHTVKFHTSAIYAKLGVANRTEALRRGVELGLLSL